MRNRRTQAQITRDRENKEIDAYNWYVVDLQENIAITGNEYKEDAIDVLSDFDGDKRYKVVSKKTLKTLGIENPNERFKSYSVGGGVGLKGNKSRIDMNHNGKIDADDFTILRNSMNGAWRNEHKHVNSTSTKNGKVIQYETRYARKYNPSRKGYKGKGNFEDGGYMDLSKMKANVVNESNAKDTYLVPEIDIENVQKLNLNITNNQIKSEDDAVRILKQLFDKNSINAYEEVKVLFLDNNNVVIGVYNHSKGGVTGTVVDIEMICALAVKCLAKGVIMCHNHPSGKLQFSEADITTSRNLKNALKLFSIVMLDSLVITENGFISMSSQGIFLRGGAFERLSNSVAERYEGNKVAPKYQRMYGKTYSKEEAMEVGDKVAGKMKSMQMQKKKAFGGFFDKVITKTKYPDLDDKQVMLKNGEYVQVVDQSDDILMVINLSQLGTGVRPRRINISEVDNTSFMSGGSIKTKLTLYKSNYLSTPKKQVLTSKDGNKIYIYENEVLYDSADGKTKGASHRMSKLELNILPLK